MNQIDLFPGKEEEKKQLIEENKSHLDSKRPQQISVSKVISQNQKWRQCKIIGKNLSIRSYSASCCFQNKFYVYGGYQILNGMMSDFYSIELQDSQQKYNWNQIQCKGKKPGSRSKHALVGGKQKIFVVGGLCDNILSSNQIYAFDPKILCWQLLKPEGVPLPHIDSFGYVHLDDNGQQKIIIIGGYDGEKAQYMNAVYEYNITKNKLSILFEGSQQEKPDIPTPRSGCAAATDGKDVYLFGGKNAQNRMNDIWAFNLTSFKYKKLQPKGHPPAERNGHSMNYYLGKLYIFGGIHDITWELDDLQIYHVDKNEWTTLEQDSPRKIQKKKVQVDKAQMKDKSAEKKSPKKKNWYDTVNTLYNNKNNSSSPDNSPMRKNFSTTYREDENNTGSPGKMIDEQRKKAFMQRKNEMLKNFETSKEEKGRYVKLETSSQAMKNSLDVIGNPDPKIKVPEGRLTDFGKESVSKFLAPLANNSNLIVGKKPCARDGHSSVILNDELIIFGGDRHQMSFNDIYKLNLGMAQKELPK